MEIVSSFFSSGRFKFWKFMLQQKPVVTFDRCIYDLTSAGSIFKELMPVRRFAEILPTDRQNDYSPLPMRARARVNYSNNSHAHISFHVCRVKCQPFFIQEAVLHCHSKIINFYYAEMYI